MFTVCAGLMRPNDSNNLDLPLFDFIHIANATNDFSNNNKIGEGGFGTVYKVNILIHVMLIVPSVIITN